MLTATANCAEIARAQTETVRSLRDELRSNDSARVWRAIESLQTLDSGQAEFVPDLVAIIETGEHATLQRVLLVLAGFKGHARPAIAPVCKLLAHRSHDVRARAVSVLVAIGSDSASALRELLAADVPRTRAAAADALRRLNRLTIGDCRQLAKDADPRVRTVAATALAGLGKPAVESMILMFSDSEPAVAYAAMQAVKTNRADPDRTVAALIKALQQSDVGVGAADALGSYGVQAQAAVPWIIKAYPLGRINRFDFEDAAESVLKHIGPPRDEDVPLVCECLQHEDIEVRILAAEYLGLAGTNARAAADALEAAALAAIEEFKLVERSVPSTPKEKRDHENAGRILVVSLDCMQALWKVTHDSRRFLELVAKVSQDEDRLSYFSGRSAWSELPTDACPTIDKILRSSNRQVRSAILHGLPAMGKRAAPLKDLVLELSKDKDPDTASLAERALFRMGPEVADVARPLLLERSRSNRIPWAEFASAAVDMQLSTEDVLERLKHGCFERANSQSAACAEALCVLTKDPLRTAQVLIQAPEEGPLAPHSAIEAMDKFRTPVPLVQPYLLQQLKSTNPRAREAAAAALGKQGERARPALDELRSHLNDESYLIRLVVAKSILQIDRDSEPFNQQLNAIFASDDNEHLEVRLDAFEMIGELRELGAPYVRLLLDQLEAHPWYLDRVLQALEGIRTTDAITEIERLAESTDWTVRSQARQSLSRVRSDPKP